MMSHMAATPDSRIAPSDQRPCWLWRLVRRFTAFAWMPWINNPHAVHAHYLRIGNGWEVWSSERVRGMERELELATMGRCTCSGCGRTVNNAWRDSDGHHCLTCLAKQRDDARAAFSPNIPDQPRAERK